MKKIENGWTQMKETYDAVLMDMRAVAGERVLFRKRLEQAEKTIVQLRRERSKLASTIGELNMGLAIMQRDRDCWHNMATRGGGRG